MDLLNNEIECQIDEEWKFHRADLLAVKDTEDGYLNGKAFYAYSIPGLQYFLSIYPYGNAEKYRGQTRVFFHVKGSEEKKITANFIISIKSANFNSQSLDYVYQRYEGWGLTCATSDIFFDTKNKFFVDGEITISIKGTFKVKRSLVTKISSPISMIWKIKESDLLPLKESNYKYLKSKRFMVSSFTDVKYYLQIYPNGHNSENQGKSWIFLQIEIGNEKNIESVFDFSVLSANFHKNVEHVYVKSAGYGYSCCSIDSLFDASKNFIVDGFLTINLNGILMVEKKNQITTFKLKKGVATQATQKKKNKSFTIFVDGKQIKVHKKVLSDASPVFAGMLESGMKEAIENKMAIEDFPFDIVDAAIKLCYSAGVRKITSIEEMFLLYKFADKYDIKLITEHVEDDLIKKISPANVCQLYDFSKSLNVTKLRQCCIEFLMKCSKESTPVYGTNILDQALLAEMFLKSLHPVADTDI